MDNEIASGKQSDSTGLALPTITKRQIGRITFDDASAGLNGGLAFYLQGVLIQTTTDSVPVSGVYTENAHREHDQCARGRISSGIGTLSQRPFVCKGTIIAASRRKLHL